MSDENFNTRSDDTTPVIMDSLISRLGKSGWLNGWQAVDSKAVSLRFSAKGSKHMAAIAKICEAHSPGCLADPSKISATSFQALIVKLGIAVPELILIIRDGPREESAALFRLVALYHREFGSEPPPSPRF
jgi:hypothetical protein